MKLSVCVDALFEGKNFLESLTAVKTCGVDAIEFWCWWDKDFSNGNNMEKLFEIKARCDALELDIITFCTKFISLTDHSLRDEFLDGLAETLSVCKLMGVDKLIMQAGADTFAPREVQTETICTTLRWLRRCCRRRG